MLRDDGAVARPGVQVRESDDEHERTRIIGVVGRIRVDTKSSQRTASHLVRDSPGLFVVPVVDARALQTAKSRETGVEHRAIVDERRLPSSGKRVAAEKGGIERHPRLRCQPFIALAAEQRIRCEISNVRIDRSLDDLAPRRPNGDERGVPFVPSPFCIAKLGGAWHVVVIARLHVEHGVKRRLAFQPNVAGEHPVGEKPPVRLERHQCDLER